MEGPHSVVRPAAGAGWVQAGAGEGCALVHMLLREKKSTTFLFQSANFDLFKATTLFNLHLLKKTMCSLILEMNIWVNVLCFSIQCFITNIQHNLHSIIFNCYKPHNIFPDDFQCKNVSILELLCCNYLMAEHYALIMLC